MVHKGSGEDQAIYHNIYYPNTNKWSGRSAVSGAFTSNVPVLSYGYPTAGSPFNQVVMVYKGSGDLTQIYYDIYDPNTNTWSGASPVGLLLEVAEDGCANRIQSMKARFANKTGIDKERFKFENTVVLLMKNNSIQQHVRNAVLLSAIVLLSIISTVVIEKVQAVTSSSSVIPGGNHNNNKTISDNSNSIGSLGLIAATPFYESNFGKIIGQRIVSTAKSTPQIEHTIVENGTLKGVGSVRNLGTWISSLKSPNTYYGVGKGVMTTADGQKATWSAYGIGRSNVNGVIIYHDIIFFNNNSTGKLAFLNNLEGLRSAEVNGNQQTTKTWEWK